jgi:micrococcal nuclease
MRYHLLLLLSLLLLTGGVGAGKRMYIASKQRPPFHLLTCKSAARIEPANALYFETRKQAITAGHRPCGVCKP